MGKKSFAFAMSKAGLMAFAAGVAMLLAASPSDAGAVRIGGTGAALGGMKLLAEAFGARHPETRVEIVLGLGSSGGIKAVLAGAVDIAVAARPLREKEQAAGAKAQEYARTPFVFATQGDNAASEITLELVAKAYLGNLETWPDGTPIRVVLRPLADSDTEIVADLSPELGEAVRAAHKRQGLRIAATDQDSADAIEIAPGSLGTSTLALIRSERRAIKALALDGVEPTPASLRDGSYKLFKSFSVVTGAGVSSDAQEFVGFVFSPEGQRILTEAGHLAVGLD